jgi:hypothetical protein
MQTKLLTAVALAIGLLIFSVSLRAHHGYAAFYTTKQVTLKGTVTEWHWVSPHCILVFDVKDDKGDIVHWATEFGGKSFARNTFKVGDEVTVTLEPAKNGAPVGRTLTVVLPDGQVLVGQRGPGTLSPTENPSDAPQR